MKILWKDISGLAIDSRQAVKRARMRQKAWKWFALGLVCLLALRAC